MSPRAYPCGNSDALSLDAENAEMVAKARRSVKESPPG
jgi:hypothetical protein